jgi:hypothetical protein
MLGVTPSALGWGVAAIAAGIASIPWARRSGVRRAAAVAAVAALTAGTVAYVNGSLGPGDRWITFAIGAVAFGVAVLRPVDEAAVLAVPALAVVTATAAAGRTDALVAGAIAVGVVGVTASLLVARLRQLVVLAPGALAVAAAAVGAPGLHSAVVLFSFAAAGGIALEPWAARAAMQAQVVGAASLPAAAALVTATQQTVVLNGAQLAVLLATGAAAFAVVVAARRPAAWTVSWPGDWPAVAPAVAIAYLVVLPGTIGGVDGGALHRYEVGVAVAVAAGLSGAALLAATALIRRRFTRGAHDEGTPAG